MAVTTTTPCFDIQTVKDIQLGDDKVRITFADGQQATLLAEHRFYELILSVAQGSLESKTPVGIAVDSAGVLVDLGRVHDSLVNYVKVDEDDPNRLAIAFWAFCAICYLTHDHPDFERIKATLEEALSANKPVWFANHLWPVESETQIWLKILDVRPVADPS